MFYLLPEFNGSQDRKKQQENVKQSNAELELIFFINSQGMQ